MIQEKTLQSIEKFIEDKRDAMIRQCSELVALPSITEDREQVSLALDYALDLGLRMGLQTKSLLGGEIGLLETGEGHEILGILAHVDVVGPGDRSKWISPPFEPELRDGKLYGRGTLDDKGAVVAVMTAMEALTKLEIPLKKQIQLILGTREETHWTDMFPLIIIILLAYMFVDVNTALGLIDMVTEGASNSLNPSLLPVMIFVVIGLLSFASGSFWGLAAIAFPIVGPLAAALGVPYALASGALISAVCFGGHICIYSDTVILTSASTQVTNVDYFKSSAPLVAIPFGLAIIGFLILGFVIV